MKKTAVLGVAMLASSVAFADTPTRIVRPVDLILFDRCSGEQVHFTGEEDLAFQVSTNNNRLHIINHVTAHINGVGLSTGADYRINFEQNVEENRDVPGSYPLEEDLLLNETVVGKGAVSNEVIRERLHITINANGQVSVVRTSVDIDCQG
jgi:hypothetical protein